MLIFYQDEFRQRWPKLYDRSTERPLTYAHRHLGFLSTFLIVIAIGLQYAGPYRQGILSRHGVDINLRDRILFTVRSGLLDIMSLGSLEAVQTCILLGTYYLYHGAPRLAWPVCGCGLRIAQALHLHRRQHPVQSTDFRTRNETRKRCWWAVYEIETFSAVAYGYPHSIRDDDCDVEPLDPSAKLQTMQSPGSFNEPLTSDPTLLSYKYFITKCPPSLKEPWMICIAFAHIQLADLIQIHRISKESFERSPTTITDSASGKQRSLPHSSGAVFLTILIMPPLKKSIALLEPRGLASRITFINSKLSLCGLPIRTHASSHIVLFFPTRLPLESEPASTMARLRIRSTHSGPP